MRTKYFVEKLEKSAEKSGSRIILAPDTDNFNKMFDIVYECGDRFAALKLHLAYLWEWGISGKGFVRLIRNGYGGVNRRIPLILDPKLADMDRTNTKHAKTYFAQGFDGLIFHGFPGPSTVVPALRLADKHKKGILLLVAMTTPDSFFTLPVIKALSVAAKRLEVDGVIAPGNKYDILKLVRKSVGNDMKIFSPGIGTQGGDATKAIMAGADYIIVGNSIINSKKPGNTIDELTQKINVALRDREKGGR